MSFPGDYNSGTLGAGRTPNIIAANLAQGGRATQIGGPIMRKPYLTKAHLPFVEGLDAVAADNTLHMQMTVEAPYVAVQLGFLNSQQFAGTITAAVSSAAVAGTATDAVSLNSGGIWSNVTLSSAFPFSTPIGTGTGSATNIGMGASITWSDIIPLASLDRTDVPGGWPILNIRSQYATGVPRTTVQQMPSNSNTNAAAGISGNSNYGWNTEDYTAVTGGRFWRCRTQAVLGVTNKALMTAAATNDVRVAIGVVIRYWLRDGQGITAVVWGDSINCACNQILMPPQGMHADARNAVSTQTNPVELATYAFSGSTPPQWQLRANILAPYHKGDLAFVPTGSINGLGSAPYNQATWNGNKLAVSQVVQTIKDAGAYVVMQTMMPVSPVGLYKFGASDVTYRHADAVRFVAGSSSANPVADVSSLTEGPQDPVTGQYSQPLVEFYDINQAHPSYASGLVAMNALLPFYRL